MKCNVNLFYEYIHLINKLNTISIIYRKYLQFFGNENQHPIIDHCSDNSDSTEFGNMQTYQGYQGETTNLSRTSATPYGR